MNLRKKKRQIHGPREKEKRWHSGALVVMLILMAIYYRATAVGSEVMAMADSESKESVGDSSSVTPRGVTVTVDQICFVGAWFLLFALATTFFGEGKYAVILNWTVLYLPLLALFQFTFSLLLGAEASDLEWIGWALFAAEMIALLAFFLVVDIYPRLIRSKWLHNNFGVGRFWSVRLISDWTMTYPGRYGKLSPVYTCKYEGAFGSSDSDGVGVPHGAGKWLDDEYDGEILSGQWRDGAPVAPFLSRRYGTGDTFSAVRVAYFMAADDAFDKNGLRPSNNLPPRIGVAGVECSVYGNFYSHLPEATQLYGPLVVGGEDERGETGGAMADICSQLLHLDLDEEGESARVEIRADDPRGVQVLRHLHVPTGVHFSKESKQVVVVVSRNKGEGVSASAQNWQRPSFLPRSSGSTKERIMIQERNPLADEFLETQQVEEMDHQNGPINYGRIRKSRTKLEVRDWARQPQKAALVFFPGFSSPLKKSLEAFGQFVAMTKLAQHVYPIVYGWPSGTLLSYRRASTASATERNGENALEMFRGLLAAGVHDIHLLSHSMGSQTLLSVFRNKDDGTRSEVSSLFRLDPAFGGASLEQGNGELLECKSISLLNPDFPVDAFVDHAFASIRQVCDHITVVGDRNDVALKFGSKLINTVCNRLGYSQPKVLRGNEGKQRGAYRLIGCDFDCLYMPEDGEEDVTDENTENVRISSENDGLLFQEVPPLFLSADENAGERRWLDVDVIDTTSLDTNIAGVRHISFTMNPILLKDLEELVITERRASKRSTLLHREGNIFSYCHAPSHVVM